MLFSKLTLFEVNKNRKCYKDNRPSYRLQPVINKRYCLATPKYNLTVFVIVPISGGGNGSQRNNVSAILLETNQLCSP